ncbi:hypothetical protein JCM8097_009112 [Rhodosporidiobolus ruineniae]
MAAALVAHPAALPDQLLPRPKHRRLPHPSPALLASLSQPRPNRHPRPHTTSPAFRLFDRLPVELVERILCFLSLEELLPLRRLSSQFDTLIRSPYLFQTIELDFRPFHLSSTRAALQSLLPGAKYLALHGFPAGLLGSLLEHVHGSRLVTLDLSYSAVDEADLVDLFGGSGGEENGVERPPSFPSLRTVILKGCRRFRSLSALFPSPSSPSSPSASLPHIRFASLTSLDLSFASLSSLPPLPLNAAFPSLRSLSLSACSSLNLDDVADAIGHLPPRLEELDLSYLGLSARDLRGMSFGRSGAEENEGGQAGRAGWRRKEGGEEDERRPISSAAALDGSSDPTLPHVLRLNLQGNDALTRLDLGHLQQRHWSSLSTFVSPSLSSPSSSFHSSDPSDFRSLKRRPVRVEIEHDGVMLDSDEEEDVRRFVEWLAGGPAHAAVDTVGGEKEEQSRL